MGRKGDGVLKYGRVVWRNKSKDLDIKVAEEPGVTFVSPTTNKHTSTQITDAGGRNWMSDFPGQIG